MKMGLMEPTLKGGWRIEWEPLKGAGLYRVGAGLYRVGAV